MLKWIRKLFAEPAVSVAIECPACRGREFMIVRPAYTGTVAGGKAEANECGNCVVCLRCDGPYVICQHEPGGVIKRRRVAAGVDIPQPPRAPAPAAPRPDANGMLSALHASLGDGRIMEEPD